MLHTRLIHGPLLAALAAAGHGSTILIADANYPIRTAVGPRAETIFLNLRSGLIAADEILDVLVETVPFEAATVMEPADGPEPEIFPAFRALLPRLALQPVGRSEFYAAARAPELAVAIASGDQRLYANLLLTVGVVPPRGAGGR